MTARRAGCVAGLLLLASIGAGCGKPVLRVADASLGDYYTPKEYRSLSDEQRAEYCQELAEQRDVFREQIEGAEEALDALRETTGPLRAEIDSLLSQTEELERRLADARRMEGTGKTRTDGAPDSKAPASADRHVVQKGESLWSISRKSEVYGRGARWNQLYRSNKDRIRDPDRIYPGQEIQIPR